MEFSKILMISSIFFAFFSCQSKKETTHEAGEKVDREEEVDKEEMLRKYRGIDFEDPWNITGFDVFNGNSYFFKRIWIDTAENETSKKIRSAKWHYVNEWFGHEDALTYRKYYGTSSLPNINLDSLANSLDVKWLIRSLKENILADAEEYYEADDCGENWQAVSTNNSNSSINMEESVFADFVFRGHWHLPVFYRNSGVAKFLWDTFQPFVFQKFSENEYKDSKADFFVKTLLETYQILKDEKEAFYELEKALESGHALNYDVYKTLSYKDKFLKEDPLADDDYTEYTLKKWEDWFFSFWFRRHIEGTTEITYEILNEIDAGFRAMALATKKEKELTFEINGKKLKPYCSESFTDDSFIAVLRKQPFQSLPFSYAPFFFDGLYTQKDIKSRIHQHLLAEGIDTSTLSLDAGKNLIYEVRNLNKDGSEKVDNGFLYKFWHISGAFNHSKILVFKRLPYFDDQLEIILGYQVEEYTDHSEGVAIQLITYDRGNLEIVDRKKILTSGVYDNDLWIYEGFTIKDDYTVSMKGYVGKPGLLHTLEREFKVQKNGKIEENKKGFAIFYHD